MQLQLVSSHGMLAILEVLEGKCSRDVTMKLLQILNMVRNSLLSSGMHPQIVCIACHGGPWLLGKLLLDRRHSSDDGCVCICTCCREWCNLILLFLGFTSKKYSSECRLEASNFIRLLCHTSVLTLQMFIS
jgi:hypothetical protein